MAIKGNGTTDKIVTGALALTAQYSVSFWYRNAAASGTGSTMTPYGWSSSAAEGIGFSYHHATEGFRQALYHFDGTYKACKFTTALLADIWYHICFTYDGVDVRGYLNGVLEAITACGAPIDSGAELISLFSTSGGTANFDDGQLTAFALWNVALTDDEITALSKGFSPRVIRLSSAVFYVPLIRDIADLRGNALTVTGTTVTDHPRIYFPARVQVVHVGAGGAPPSAKPYYYALSQGLRGR